MSNSTPSQTPITWGVRVLALLITVVISGLGLLALINGYEPARLTPLGQTNPLFDGAARHFGSSMLLFGLLPLMLLANSKKHALWFGLSVATLAMINLFFGAPFWE